MAEPIAAEKVASKPSLRETAPWWPLLVWFGPAGGLALFSFIPLATVGVKWLNAFEMQFGWLAFLHFTTMLLIVFSLPIQGTLIGLCWGLGTGKFWQRTFGVLVVAMAALQCLLLGFLFSGLARWLHDPQIDFFFLDPTAWLSFEYMWPAFLLCGCGLPLLLFGFQVPFLLMRILFRWRLVRVESIANENLPSDDPLSIRDLLLGTALVAVSLAAARYEGRKLEAEARQAPNSYLFGILITVAAAAAVTTVTILPMTAIFLRKHDLRGAWLRGSLIATTVAALYAVPNIALWQASSWIGLLVSVANILLYYAGVATGLTLLRRYGWRLHHERKLAA